MAKKKMKLCMMQNAGELDIKNSIVDLLKSKNTDSSYQSRKKLYQNLVGSNYTGTEDQNIHLLQLVNSSASIKQPAASHPTPTKYVKAVVPPSNLTFSRPEAPGVKAPSVVQTPIMRPVSQSPVANKRTQQLAPNTGPKLPESGFVADKGNNMGYILKGGKPVHSFKILTGKDSAGEENITSTEAGTPVGYYNMHPVADPKHEYDNNIMELNPLSAYNMNAPKSYGLAAHETYDHAHRDPLYNEPSANRYVSHGCINMGKIDFECMRQYFPQGDTTMIIDSRKPQFRDIAANLQKKYGGGGKMKLCMNCGGKVKRVQNAAGFSKDNPTRRFDDASEAQIIPISQPLGPGEVPDSLPEQQGDLAFNPARQKQPGYGFDWTDLLHAGEDAIQYIGGQLNESKNLRNERKLRIQGLQPVEEQLQDKDKYGLNQESFLQNAGSIDSFYAPWGALASTVQQEGWRPSRSNNDFIEYSPTYNAAGNNVLIGNDPRGRAMIRANRTGNFDVLVRDLQGEHPDSYIKQGVDAATAHGYFTGSSGPVSQHVQQLQENIPSRKMKLGGSSKTEQPEMAKRGWMKKAVNPAHKGYCTPMTKSTCTPKRKAFAMTMKKHHGFHQDGGAVLSLKRGGPSPSKAQEMLDDGTAHGQSLTSKQKRYFHLLADKKQYGGGESGITYPPDDQSILEMGGNGNPSPEVWAESGEVARMNDGSIVHIDGDMPGTYDHGERKGIPGTPVDHALQFLEATSGKMRRNAMADKMLLVPRDEAYAMTGIKTKKALSHATLFLQANEKHDKMRTKMQKRIKLQMQRGGDSEGYRNSLKMNMQFANSIPTADNLFDTVFAHQEDVKQRYGIPDGPTNEQEDQYSQQAQHGYNSAGNPQYSGNSRRYLPRPGEGESPFTNFGEVYNYYNKYFGYNGPKGNDRNSILAWQKWAAGNPEVRPRLLNYLRNVPLTNKGKADYPGKQNQDLNDQQLLSQFQDAYFDYRAPRFMPTAKLNLTGRSTAPGGTPDLLTAPDMNIPGAPEAPPTPVTGTNLNKGKKPPYFPLQYEDIAASKAAYIAALNRDPETLLHTDVPRIQNKLLDPTRSLHEIDMDASAAMMNAPGGMQGSALRAQVQANRDKSKLGILGQYDNQNVGIVNQQEATNAQLSGQENMYRTQNLSNFIDHYLQSRAVADEQKLQATDSYYKTVAKNKMFNRMVQMMDPRDYTITPEGSFNFDGNWQISNPLAGYTDNTARAATKSAKMQIVGRPNATYGIDPVTGKSIIIPTVPGTAQTRRRGG